MNPRKGWWEPAIFAAKLDRSCQWHEDPLVAFGIWSGGGSISQDWAYTASRKIVLEPSYVVRHPAGVAENCLVWGEKKNPHISWPEVSEMKLPQWEVEEKRRRQMELSVPRTTSHPRIIRQKLETPSSLLFLPPPPNQPPISIFSLLNFS